MSKILKRAIKREIPNVKRVHVDEEFAYIQFKHDQRTAYRYRLSPEAKRVVLLEREGRLDEITYPYEFHLLGIAKE